MNTMKKRYFTKFVPYNNFSISNLENNNIRFSTVYEFNDFNELHYLSPPPDCMSDNMQILIKNKISDKSYQCQLIQNIKNGNFEKAFVTELCEYIEKYSNQSQVEQKYFQCILETIAYSSVGIFCLSSIDVFKDDSAQIMFAHYAGNLSGLALIYELKDIAPTPVNYLSFCKDTNTLNETKKIGSGGNLERVLDWSNARYNNMDDFLNKSGKWQYEMEHRLFNAPGIRTLDNSIMLKAIFHTQRFNNIHKETLLTLNEKIYENKILIKEIAPSNSSYYFVIIENNNSIYDWLCNLN